MASPEAQNESDQSQGRGGAGVLDEARALFQIWVELAHDRFRLAALETQKAGQSLVTMVVASVMVGLLLSSAWLGLLVAAVLILVDQGIPISQAILLAVAANLLAVLALASLIRHKRQALGFPASIRSLQPPKQVEQTP